MNPIHLTTIALLVTGFATAQGTEKVTTPVKVKTAIPVPQGKTPPAAKPAKDATQDKQDKQDKAAEAPKKVDPAVQLRTSLRNATREAEHLREVQKAGGLLARFKRTRAATQKMANRLTPKTLGPAPAPSIKGFRARLMGDGEKAMVAKDVLFLIEKRAIAQPEFDSMVEYLGSYPRAEATEDVKSQAIAALVRAHAGDVLFAKTAQPALDAIQELSARLAKGESFSELAKAHSDDLETRDQGGKRGFIVRNAAEKTYAKAAFSLKVGQVSKVVRSIDGYHLIRLLAKKKGTTADLDQVKTSHILKRFTPNQKDAKELRRRLDEGIVDVAFRKDELRKFCPKGFK